MKQIYSQFRRVFSDNGTGDKDFTDKEEKLRCAQKKLLEATNALTRASEILTDLIHGRSESLH